MCGVLGFVDKNEILSVAERTYLANQMLDCIEHRGKDDRGVVNSGAVTSAHVRLAILDTSANGGQPFTNEQRTLVLSYNGEIYNHQKVRALLSEAEYRTSSDTETVFRAFEQLGSESLSLMNGMFALSIHDVSDNSLLLAVDRFGIKPLYYIETNNWFAWSSEIKAFRLLPGISFEVNADKLFEHGVFRTIYGQETLFKDVRSVTPGTYVSYKISTGHMSVGSYRLKEEASISLERSLVESVSEHLQSDVPVGIQLSGGVDSSLTAVLARKAIGKSTLHTFSIGLVDKLWNEFPYARTVSDQIGSVHHELTFDEISFCRSLPLATYYHDEPISHPNSVAMMFLAKEAGKCVQVLLTGEGADELFGGYRRYTQLLSSALTNEKLLYSNAACSAELMDALITLPAARKSLSEREKLVESIAALSDLRRLSEYDLATFIPSLLLRQDKMGMAATVESRVPFLTGTLLAIARSLPDEERATFRETKVALKRIAAELLPANLVYRRKCGFGLPISDWLRNPFGLGKYLRLLDRDDGHLPLARDMIQRLIDEHLVKKADNSEVLWVLICLEIWYQIFIDGHKPDTVWQDLSA